MDQADFILPLGDGIYAIDTGFYRPRFDAAYLMVEGDRAAFIDTGTNFAVPRLLAALAHVGLTPEAVDYVIPTHVHLDHAGGVGLLVQHLPRATVLVHPRGERHLIDPRALYQGALAVYGRAEMERSYGTLQPVPAGRVRASSDGMTVALAGRTLYLADTPGHARHHHCVWDERSRGWFTGDTFGLSYREFDTAAGPWILPTSTPVQFEPDVLKRTIARMIGFGPRAMYLTHFSRVERPAELAQTLCEQIDEMVALGEAQRTAPDRHALLRAGLEAQFRRRLARHGIVDIETAIGLLQMDLDLNAQGLGIWLDRSAGA